MNDINKNNSAIGRSWEEVRAELFTPEEIAESNLRVALIGELIKARQENYKKRINNKKILKQLERYMKNENVEWNKEIALQMIDNELENLIAKYIDAIQE